MRTESSAHMHPTNGGAFTGKTTEQESTQIEPGSVASHESGQAAVDQIGGIVSRHPGEAVAVAATAGLLTGVALGAAFSRTAARAITAAIVGTATVGFVNVLRANWGMTLEMFSRLTGYAPRTIASWEAGAKPNKGARRTLAKVQRLRDALTRVTSPDFIGEWMETPNQAFDGLKPLEVWERGEEDRIGAMIFYLESGVPS
jgi:DNA-binding transcriptional regulator YiaG